MRKELKEKILKIFRRIRIVNNFTRGIKGDQFIYNLDLIDKIESTKIGLNLVNRDKYDKICGLQLWRLHSPYIKIFKSDDLDYIFSLILDKNVPGLNVTYKHIFKKIVEQDWKCNLYIIGGCIRDIILNKMPNDIDISVSCSMSDLKKICKSDNWKFYNKNNYFMIGDKNGSEYLEGKDIYCNLGDLKDGEFNMNMVFYDWKNKILIDKTGLGIENIYSKRIDFCRDMGQWESWFSPNKFFRYLKFRQRKFTAGIKQKKFIYTQMRKKYRKSDYNYSYILIRRLDNNDKNTIKNLIINELMFLDMYDFIPWYNKFIDKFYPNDE